MARITVEDCLENVDNRFSLVRLASKRAKQLLNGKKAVTDTRGNRCVVSALREIADGKVKFMSKQEISLRTLRKPAEQSEEASTTATTETPESTTH